MADADLARGTTVHALFERAFRVFADRTAVTFGEASWTYAEVGSRSHGGLHTGDILVADDHGLLSFVDRTKFLIKTGGENVYPVEVEAALTAKGEHFSAGGDAGSVADAVEGGTTPELMVSFHRMLRALRDCDRPVVAVFGAVYGGAFNLALACDVVIAAADTKLCQVFLRLGVVPDLGAAYLLARAVGTQRATELVLSTRVVDADEALSLGIVSRVSPTRVAAVADAVAFAAIWKPRP